MLENNHKEELGRKGQKKQQFREKGALEKEQHNHEKELGKNKKKSQRKAKEKPQKGRICRDRSNNAMLKRTQKRKQ